MKNFDYHSCRYRRRSGWRFARSALCSRKGEDLRGEIARFLESKGITLKKNKLDQLVDELKEEIQK